MTDIKASMNSIGIVLPVKQGTDRDTVLSFRNCDRLSLRVIGIEIHRLSVVSSYPSRLVFVIPSEEFLVSMPFIHSD